MKTSMRVESEKKKKKSEEEVVEEVVSSENIVSNEMITVCRQAAEIARQAVSDMNLVVSPVRILRARSARI